LYIAESIISENNFGNKGTKKKKNTVQYLSDNCGSKLAILPYSSS
jgi:hypothetical protein